MKGGDKTTEISQPTLFEQPPPEHASETRGAAWRDVASEEAATARESTSGLGARQEAVWRVIRSASVDITNAEIAQHLGWPINRVTPRTLELRQQGLVVKGRKRKCTAPTSGQRPVQAWRPAQQDARFSANPCVRVYGYGPEGAACKTCRHLERRHFNRTIFKCALRNNTRSPATDHRAGWPACGKYEEDHHEEDH